MEDQQRPFPRMPDAELLAADPDELCEELLEPPPKPRPTGILYIVDVVSEAVLLWLATRPYRAILWASPVVLLMMVVLAVGVFASMSSSRRVAARYHQAARDAVAEKDYKQADFYYRKLFQLGPVGDPLLFEMALCTEKAEGVEAAVARMRQIAGDQRPGYGPAHLWLAQKALSGEWPREVAAARAVIERHLPLAVRQLEDPRQAQQLLAYYYRATEQVEKAIEVMQELALRDQSMLVALAQLYKEGGREQQARDAAERARRYHQEQFASGQRLEPNSFLRWAAALEILGKPDEAEQTLLEGFRRFSDSEELRQQLGRFYLGRSEQVAAGGSGAEGGMVRRLEFLERALAYTPDDAEVLAQLAKLTAHQGPAAERARELLQPVLASGKAPWLVHFTLGTLAADEGDQQTALKHLELAFQINPNSPYVVNNLAWVLLHQPQPDVARVRELVDRALALRPNHPNFRETRAELHLREGRYQEAIIDLETALGQFGEGQVDSRRRIHQQLVAAYEAFGDQAMAGQHRAALEQLDAPP